MSIEEVLIKKKEKLNMFKYNLKEEGNVYRTNYERRIITKKNRHEEGTVGARSANRQRITQWL